MAGRLAERGAVHIDADQLAREVVEPGTSGLEAIAAEFGPLVLDADGRLDRAALGSIVFADPDKLAKLNGITHPAIKALAKQRMADAAARDRHAVVVYDVPLLVEAGVAHGYDLVVVVEAPADTRTARLVDLRGMDPDAAASRIRSQASDAERRTVADVVIDSAGTLEHTLEQADAVWERALRPER